MNLFGDFHTICLNKDGEELCGDQVRVSFSNEKIRMVLSDGLGSGVKANILSTLTAEIIINMMREEAPLPDIIETIVGTLPTCKVRKMAYATFTVIEIERKTGRSHIYNFDNPAVLYFHNGASVQFPERVENIGGRKIMITECQLEAGDFIAVVSDGVVHAGLGNIMNFGWSLPNVAKFIEGIYKYHPSSARPLVQRTMGHTRELYGDCPGDDASMVGILLRASRKAMVFTGPPLDEANDAILTQRLMAFDGERIICGGTTANIVATCTGQNVVTDMASLREDVPPIGQLDGIDLVTEGILTLNRTSEWIDQSGGNINNLPEDNNGAYLLTKALLNADEIVFLVGQKVNPFYQNPLLPVSISIRKYLIEKIAGQLRQMNKHISVEFY